MTQFNIGITSIGSNFATLPQRFKTVELPSNMVDRRDIINIIEYKPREYQIDDSVVVSTMGEQTVGESLRLIRDSKLIVQPYLDDVVSECVLNQTCY